MRSERLLTVLILTQDEEQHIVRAIASVRAIATQVIVIDSGSTDRTIELAQANDAFVMQNRFVNHAQQFQWGLEHAPIESRWVMRLDADEFIEEDLAAELLRTLPVLPADIVGINLKRKHIFMGRFIRFGGRYPLVMLRIFRSGHGRVEQRWMDEHILVERGRVITLDGGFCDCNLNDLGYFVDKHNRYATKEAVEVLNAKFKLFPADLALTAHNTSRQAALKRWAKNQIYNRMPLGIGPLLYFFWRYIVLFGFLDGREGLIYHFLQGFWYRVLIDAKVLELERMLQAAPSDVRCELLARATGLSIDQTANSPA